MTRSARASSCIEGCTSKRKSAPSAGASTESGTTSRPTGRAFKRSGSRDYVEFDLRESKAFTRVGRLLLRLNKTDDRHQRYTVTVVVNDRPVEKKDNALLEPVQFYMPGSRSVTELVAQEVQDGRIKGYVSSPKDTTAPVAVNAPDSG